MLSVVIPTLNSERALVATLAPLVSGATAGLIVEVILADGGSQDDTAAVADVAGCLLMASSAPLGSRLREAAAAARAPWLMFLRPGIILDTPWTSDAGRFVQQGSGQERAAVFRRGNPAGSFMREILMLLTAALGRLPDPAQGLLIHKRFYESLGGHSGETGAPESDLIRRIGRSRLVTLATGAFPDDT